MLIIQIAGGIILAFLVIRFWRVALGLIGCALVAILAVSLILFLRSDMFDRWLSGPPSVIHWLLLIGIFGVAFSTTSRDKWKAWYAAQISESSTLRWWRQRKP